MGIESDILKMKECVLKRNFRGNMDLWNKAFNLYNTHNNKRLSFNCLSCYPKVLNFIIQNKGLWT